MKIGVKYCGGCNPRFDRSQLFRRIIADFRHIYEVELVKDLEVYDRIFVIGGCMNCCAKADHYTVKGEVIRLRSIEDYEKYRGL